MKRHEFVPEVIWVDRDDGFLGPLHRADDPEKWAELCDADAPVITQVDEGYPEDGKGLWPTSSASAPSIVAGMLDALDVAEGMRVLEIGTGTGYNAALLAERVGAGNVITVEVDPAIADHARQALDRLGYPVTMVIGDGAQGYAPGAPYDRVLATAAAHRIPYAWVDQTRPGGRIVVPWASPFLGGDALLSLTVREDGTATGSFGAQTAFMPLRGHTSSHVSWMDSDYDETTTRLDPREPFDPGDFDAVIVFGAMFPDCLQGLTVGDDGVHTRRLSHPPSGSWASFTPADHGVHTVRQHGPRRLWNEVEAAHRWWVDAGRPGRERFGLTVTPDGQWVWLDEPSRTVTAARS